MAYATREIDHEKRKNGEGSYSPYNWIYHYLMDNFEPGQVPDKADNLLFRECKAYCLKTGVKMDDTQIHDTVDRAKAAFDSNNGARGDVAHNLGKRQENSFDTIKATISDLRW